MAIDRKAYKADKKAYKKEVKAAKRTFKETGFKSYGNPFAPKRSDYKEGANIRYEESPIQEKENLLKKNPVVNRSDDNENIGRGGKGPKPMSRTRRAKASVMKLKDGLVSRFQSSTPKIGKNELMKPVIESLIPTVVEAGPEPTPMQRGFSKIIKAPEMNYAKGSATISSHAKTTIPNKKKK